MVGSRWGGVQWGPSNCVWVYKATGTVAGRQAGQVGKGKVVGKGQNQSPLSPVWAGWGMFKGCPGKPKMNPQGRWGDPSKPGGRWQQ